MITSSVIQQPNFKKVKPDLPPLPQGKDDKK